MPLPLTRAGRTVATVFDLLGDDENDMSAAFGYALSQSAEFTVAMLRRVMPSCDVSATVARSDATIALQSGRVGHGITDVEVLVSGSAYVIFEAKRGAWMPSETQLAQYATVLAKHPLPHRALATLTSVAPALVHAHHLPTEMFGVPVVHCTWREVAALARSVRGRKGHTVRRELDRFVDYLERILGMDSRYSNMVYVVSLGDGKPTGWTLGWRDIVNKAGRYFYPAAKGWPAEPPNYIAFRYDGRLQSIHHVDATATLSNFHDVFPEAPNETVAPHYCLTLGPAIRPKDVVKNGPRIHMQNRCWCMLDTLLTAPTVSDALTETERRRSPN